MRALFAQADAMRLPLEDLAVDLVVTSPPYLDARLYLEDGKNLGIARKCEAWIDWMLDVLTECQRVCRGPVIVVCAGKTEARNYQPGPEGLLYRWYQRGGECHSYRPVYWHRVGIPGSGGDDWFRADVEYCLCFKRPGALPFSDNTACGHPPKWAPGGEMSNRLSNGARVNQYGNTGGNGGYRADGTAKPRYFNGNGAARNADNGNHNSNNRLQRGNAKGKVMGKIVTKRTNGGDGRVDEMYFPPVLANPGNLFKSKVGGGLMGHPAAHENEAPFEEKLVEFFIRSLAPPGGRVLDCFSGSGTTASVATRLGRVGIGFDLRMSQCRLGNRRCANVQRELFTRRKETEDERDR